MKETETIEITCHDKPSLPVVSVPEQIGVFYYDSTSSSTTSDNVLLPLSKIQPCIKDEETAETFFGYSETESLLYRIMYAVTTDNTPTIRCLVYVTPRDKPSLFQLQFFADGYKRSTPYPITPLMFKHFPELQTEIDKGLLMVSEEKDK